MIKKYMWYTDRRDTKDTTEHFSSVDSQCSAIVLKKWSAIWSENMRVILKLNERAARDGGGGGGGILPLFWW